MLQKIKLFIKERKLIIGIGVVLIGSGLYFGLRTNTTANTTVTVTLGNFEKVVSISGKVIPAQSVELGFETSGTVAGVYKNVGDKVNKGEVIAVLDTSDVVAQRDMARADLLAAQAELKKINDSTVGSDVSTNREQVVNAIIDAYTKSDDAIRNRVDQYFDNPRTGPEIKYTFHDYFSTKDKINNSRALLENDLENFESMTSALSVDSYTDDKLLTAKRYVQKVKAFLDIVSFAVNSFEESHTLTSAMIDGYRSSLATARNNVNATLIDLATYESKLHSSISDASIQEAKVKSKEANVRSYDAQIAKGVIVAPFTGIISLQDAKVGESVGQNTKVASMISDGYEVEAYIPEVNISGIALGNQAKVTLDAYGDEEFLATIIHIDPAETMRDGVSNYKIKLAFDKPDARILSGMTADVNIVTLKILDVIVLPERVVVTEGDRSYVMVQSADDPIKTPVTLGRKDGKGNIEITSGLAIGQKVILNP